MKAKKASVKTKVPDEFLVKVGAKLAKRRKELGYKNRDYFAYEKEINRTQYGKYEAGRQDMRISTLRKTLRTLNITLKDFFSEGLDY